MKINVKKIKLYNYTFGIKPSSINPVKKALVCVLYIVLFSLSEMLKAYTTPDIFSLKKG